MAKKKQRAETHDSAAEFDPDGRGRQPGTTPGRPPARKPWKQRFGFRRDNEVGVRIEEGRKNGLRTILPRDPLPDGAVRLLREGGWLEDPEGGWSRPIDRPRPRESRERADAMALAVDDLLRELKGLPPRESFYLSRA